MPSNSQTQNQTNKLILHDLNIVQINVNSIITNERRVTLLDCLTKYKPDVVLLSETKLNSRHKISFNNYSLIRRDRVNSKQAGGTAIIIRNDIKFKNIQPYCVKNSTCFESTVLELKFQYNRKLYLVAAYATSNCKKEFMMKLKELFDTLKLNKPDNYYILADDLNAKHHAWGNSINNARGVSLNKWILENQITYKIELYRTAVPSYPKSDSGHRASILTISISSTEYFLFDETIPLIKYDFSSTDWTTFNDFLINHHQQIIPNNRNLTTNEIDNHIDTLNKSILQAIETTVPRIDHDKNSTDKYITPKIKNLRKQKSYTITQINRLTNPWNYTSAYNSVVSMYKETLKIIRYEIKKALQESISNYWSRKVSKISIKSPSELFPSVNKHPENPHLQHRSPKKSQNQPTKSTDRTRQTSYHKHSSQARRSRHLFRIGPHLKRTHGKTTTLQFDPTESKFSETKNTKRQRREHYNCPNVKSIPTNFFTSFVKLENTFRNLNNKKSASFDGIPNIVLKHLPRQYIFHYTILFNNCLHSAHFPAAWKTAKLITIKKKGKDSSDPNSYRPISLLPNISKVFETIHAITKFTSDICWARNAGDCIGAVMIDLEKAFDTVWLDGLFYKLLKKDFPIPLIKLLWNMLHDKKFYVTNGP
ncbi:uncharacterized protein LOC143423842 [Xylocopa sonorina]|uniref:uncharacterized protein LOC143423842 n=1 Tax=Xylocopa sonorina TaxID=1818115 RepID=UPI00403ADCE7